MLLEAKNSHIQYEGRSRYRIKRYLRSAFERTQSCIDTPSSADAESLFYSDRFDESLLISTCFNHIESTGMLLHTLLYIICCDKIKDRVPQRVQNFLISDETRSLTKRYSNPHKIAIRKEKGYIEDFLKTVKDQEVRDFLQAVIMLCDLHLKFIKYGKGKNRPYALKGLGSKCKTALMMKDFGMNIMRYSWLSYNVFVKILLFRFVIDYHANWEDNRDMAKQKFYGRLRDFGISDKLYTDPELYEDCF